MRPDYQSSPLATVAAIDQDFHATHIFALAFDVVTIFKGICKVCETVLTLIRFRPREGDRGSAPQEGAAFASAIGELRQSASPAPSHGRRKTTR